MPNNLVAGQSIDDVENHFVRHCSGGQKNSDNQLTPEAFSMREDETYVSVGYLEFFSGTFQECLRDVKDDMCRAREVRPSHLLAVFNIGDIKAIADAFVVSDYALKFHPKENYCSHAGLYGVGFSKEAEQYELHHRLAMAPKHKFSGDLSKEY